jgi:hypothetical protein
MSEEQPTTNPKKALREFRREITALWDEVWRLDPNLSALLPEWIRLRDCAENLQEVLTERDRYRVYSAGYFILDRAKLPAEALKCLETYPIPDAPTKINDRFNHWSRLFYYSAFNAADYRKAAVYLRSIIDLAPLGRNAAARRVELVECVLEKLNGNDQASTLVQIASGFPLPKSALRRIGKSITLRWMNSVRCTTDMPPGNSREPGWNTRSRTT